MSLNNARILVTGATGFIGSRLVAWLDEVEHAQVVALVRQFKNASRISRYPIEMRSGDVRDIESLRNAMRNCTHVVHCAMSVTGSAQENRLVTVNGAENICRVARESGVRRIVYLSTISVYGETPPGRLNEQTLCRPKDAYGQDKLDAEAVFAREHTKDMSCVTLRLPVVYGPWSYWSTHPIGQLQKGRVILPDDGAGKCNSLYVDDAVRAIVCGLGASVENQAVTCLISGATPVTWRRYYEGHGSALDTPVIISGMPTETLRRTLDAKASKPVVQRLWNLRDEARIVLRIPGAQYGYDSLKAVIRLLIPAKKSAAPSGEVETVEQRPEVYPERGHVELMASQSSADITRARQVLGFQPQVTFEEGAVRTAAWFRWSGLANA